MELVDLISNYGFPIVCVIGLAWYVREQQKLFSDELAKQREEHKEEVKELTNTISNNTLVVQKLVDLLDRKE
jgi:hypothetical protein